MKKETVLLNILAAWMIGGAAVVTAHAATTVNYDTAWTFVYDGGTNLDVFYDVKSTNNGSILCAGESCDTTSGMAQTIVMKFDASGKVLQKKLYNTQNTQNARYNSQYVHSLVIAKNGDLIMGGVRYIGPFVMRTDSLGNIKWATWYYDSVGNKNLLQKKGTVNCLRETSRGTIICAAGDEYPDNNGQPLNNYAAFLELDSAGKMKNWGEVNNMSGYSVGAFNIEETQTGNYLLSGNQNVFYIDTNGGIIWQKKHTFMLDGVGSEVNNINRAKMLRNGTLMVAGQAYEGNCWTNYQKLYYDAWWSPISYAYGTNTTWDTAGWQGRDDNLYDFTQLNNGNIVFIGDKGSVSDSGIWAFVTDSTGKNILWEKQHNVQYRSDKGNGLTPLAVSATSDGGFTIVGKDICVDSLGGMNAFVAHYIPVTVKTIRNSQAPLQSNTLSRCAINGSRAVFSFTLAAPSPVELSIFNPAGKRVAQVQRSDMPAGQNTLSWESWGIGRGVYVYRVSSVSGALCGRFAVGK
jgi:hypothetical protein